jgi:hypothetical protein
MYVGLPCKHAHVFEVHRVVIELPWGRENLIMYPSSDIQNNQSTTLHDEAGGESPGLRKQMKIYLGA